ncbi:MAG: response regulator transcription factor [Pseudomonadota bacterium]
MRILIADDHELVRDTISAFLQREGGFEVTAADDYFGAAEEIKKRGPYDLVLLDFSMPGMEGLTTLAAAKELNRDKPVALISGAADKAIAQDALAAGAAGFLPKSMAAKSLISAVKFMIMGEQYAPLDFMTAEEPENDHPLKSKLSEREFQVLEGLCKGQSNKEIARDLDLQEVTIKLHVKTLCRKLEAKNRTQAAMIAKEERLF